MSQRLSHAVEQNLATGEPVILVTVASARGSTPRAEGTAMAVTKDRIFGTIGGGRLEWEAITRARAMIEAGQNSDSLDMPLGPAVGQCCGGHVVLSLDRANQSTAEQLARQEAQDRRHEPQVMIFGAGHVGKALIQALIPLPVSLCWSDSRSDVFPEQEDPRVHLDRSDPVDLARAAKPGTAAVVLTHSHALDYAITEAVLVRGDLAYVGLIGSRTKRRRFERWFTARGGDPRALDRLVCPIGDFGVDDNRPEVIAALVTAEVLRALQHHKQGGPNAAVQRQEEEAL